MRRGRPLHHSALHFCRDAIVMPTETGNRRFSLLYKGDRIGAYTVLYSSASGERRINTETHLFVNIAFFTVVAFTNGRDLRGQRARLTSKNEPHTTLRFSEHGAAISRHRASK
jgi:hypothetical protein